MTPPADDYETICRAIVDAAESDATLDAVSRALVSIRAREWADTARAAAAVGASSIASYSLAGRSVTRADLATLEARADALWAQLAALVELPTASPSAPVWMGVDFRGAGV